MAKAKVVKYGHWISHVGEFDPLKVHGFVYLVYCKETGKFYIGKKQTVSIRKVKVAGKVRKKSITKESDWMNYKTSSEYVAKDIEKYGMDAFEFYIVGVYKTKGGCRYAETNLLHKLDANVIKIDNTTRLFYNLSIDAIRFVPTEFDPKLEARVKAIMKLKVKK